MLKPTPTPTPTPAPTLSVLRSSITPGSEVDHTEVVELELGLAYESGIGSGIGSFGSAIGARPGEKDPPDDTPCP